jgi:hypothetical protein
VSPGMEPLVAIGVGSLVLLLILVLVLAEPRPHERLGAERSYAAEAEVEESDIEQMLEARNEIRRRRGLPEIGDELVEELRREAGRRPEPPPR